MADPFAATRKDFVCAAFFIPNDEVRLFQYFGEGGSKRPLLPTGWKLVMLEPFDRDMAHALFHVDPTCTRKFCNDWGRVETLLRKSFPAGLA